MFKKKSTPFQDHLKEKNINPKSLDIETFGEIMDDFLTSYSYTLVLSSPKGSQNVNYQDNAGLGPVTVLFFLLKAIRVVVKQTSDMVGGFENEKLAEMIAEMVRDDILEGLQEADAKDEP